MLTGDVSVVPRGLKVAVVVERHAPQVRAGGGRRGARDQVRVEARVLVPHVVGVIDLLG